MSYRFPPPILLLVVLLTACCLAGCSNSSTSPVAHRGQLDLSTAHSQLRSSSVRLAGEWEFYWKQLLAPDDFLKPAPPKVSDYLPVPSVWNKRKEADRSRKEAGYATVRLTINPGAFSGEVLLELPYIYAACRIWANGRLLFESGTVGRNLADEIPGQGIQKAHLYLDGSPVELVLQVSNFHFREGGIPSVPLLGSESYMQKNATLKQALSWLFIGSLVVMVVVPPLPVLAVETGSRTALFCRFLCGLDSLLSHP